jgi:hypothetical protein
MAFISVKNCRIGAAENCSRPAGGRTTLFDLASLTQDERPAAAMAFFVTSALALRPVSRRPARSPKHALADALKIYRAAPVITASISSSSYPPKSRRVDIRFTSVLFMAHLHRLASELVRIAARPYLTVIMGGPVAPEIQVSASSDIWGTLDRNRALGDLHGESMQVVFAADLTVCLGRQLKNIKSP